MTDTPIPAPSALLEAPFALLSDRVATTPGDPAFVAVAEAWRKRGELAEALRVVSAGLGSRPRSIPAWITQAWILRDQGRLPEAEAAIREALAIDPDHPVARATLAEVRVPPTPPSGSDEIEVVEGDTPDEEAFADGISWPELEADDALVTESLAALYRQQGHLEQAAMAYAALVEAHPESDDLRRTLEAVRTQIAVDRPLTFSVEATGGQGVRDWLAGVAAARPPVAARGTRGMDAFFAIRAPRTSEPVPDLDAFQRWLRGLEPRP